MSNRRANSPQPSRSGPAPDPPSLPDEARPHHWSRTIDTIVAAHDPQSSSWSRAENRFQLPINVDYPMPRNAVDWNPEDAPGEPSSQSTALATSTVPIEPQASSRFHITDLIPPAPAPPAHIENIPVPATGNDVTTQYVFAETDGPALNSMEMGASVQAGPSASAVEHARGSIGTGHEAFPGPTSSGSVPQQDSVQSHGGADPTAMEIEPATSRTEVHSRNAPIQDTSAPSEPSGYSVSVPRQPDALAQAGVGITAMFRRWEVPREVDDLTGHDVEPRNPHGLSRDPSSGALRVQTPNLRGAEPQDSGPNPGGTRHPTMSRQVISRSRTRNGETTEVRGRYRRPWNAHNVPPGQSDEVNEGYSAPLPAGAAQGSGAASSESSEAFGMDVLSTGAAGRNKTLPDGINLGPDERVVMWDIARQRIRPRQSGPLLRNLDDYMTVHLFVEVFNMQDLSTHDRAVMAGMSEGEARQPLELWERATRRKVGPYPLCNVQLELQNNAGLEPYVGQDTAQPNFANDAGMRRLATTAFRRVYGAQYEYYRTVLA